MRKLVLFVTVAVFFHSPLIAQNKVNNDSITVAVEPDYDHVNGIHRFFFGNNYRKLWAAPVKLRVMHFSKEKGGLKAVERGGGLQTKSLKVKDASGREWVLRSIQKYPEKGLPKKLRKTIAKDILQDQVSTGHPFAALTVPPIADALGIPHTNPEIVYLADDKSLGEYRKDFGGQVLLFEERYLKGSSEVEKTDQLQNKLEADNKYKVDQKLLLRARIMDHILGDWDRHEDQWSWQPRKAGSETVYIPEPHDRDKVFYSTSGVFPKLLSYQSLKSQLQPYHSDIRDVAGYNYNNRYFDRYFLNEMDENDWREQIQYVQTHLTDQVIENAVRRLPEPIYSLSAERIIKSLKGRRESMMKEGLKYYRFLAENVDIHGSNKGEVFRVTNQADKKVEVSIIRAGDKAGTDQPVYKRTFNPSVTDEIRLYGLAGADNFLVSGEPNAKIKVRMVGGAGRDKFLIDSNINSRTKLYIYDSTTERNLLPDRSVARIRTRADSAVNYFNRKDFKYPHKGPSVSLLFNPDVGALLGISYNYLKYGFRKEPFAEKHRIAAGYSTTRQALGFAYTGYFVSLIGKNDLVLDFLSRGPKNVSNFFGIGNETPFPNTGDRKIDFYRNRFDLASGDIKLVRTVSKKVAVSAGVSLLWYGSSTKNNNDRFFKVYNGDFPGDYIFHNRFYVGLTTGFEFDTRNNSSNAASGVFWNVQLSGSKQTNDTKAGAGKLFTDLSHYLPLKSDSTVVLANRVGIGTTFGKPSFFQMMQLGGASNLRGFYNNRFTGKTMFFHNIDLRAKLFDFTSYIVPGSLGVIAFNDIGRVWVPGEKSTTWHHGYGGGIYVSPAELVLIQALAGFSKEGFYPYVSIGFTF